MISLRPVVDGDAAWLDTWLAPVAASVGYEIDGETAGGSIIARTRRERGVQARIIERDGASVGMLVYRSAAPKRGSAIIELVAAPPAFARCGAGMGAAVLVEDELRAAGARVVYAPAPAVHGIAMYFWIRLGYRPLMRGEWPCERVGVAWLVREL
jgi:hypothetical protein